MEQQTVSKPVVLLDKAFFGKDNCMTVQLSGKNCFFKFGKKVNGSWNWKPIKFSDMELGEIIRVISGEQREAKFYHSFNNENTQIWIANNEERMVLKVGEHTKGLSKGEQKVLQVILERMIWMMNIT